MKFEIRKAVLMYEVTYRGKTLIDKSKLGFVDKLLGALGVRSTDIVTALGEGVTAGVDRGSAILSFARCRG